MMRCMHGEELLVVGSLHWDGNRGSLTDMRPRESFIQDSCHPGESCEEKNKDMKFGKE